MRRVRPYHYENAYDDAEEICYCPPSEVGEGGSDSGDDGGDKGDEPSKLSKISVSLDRVLCC